MTGETHYHKIPLLTRFFKITFYLSWRDGKFHKIGFKRDTMTLEEAVTRLERKRIRREYLENLTK